MAGRKAGRLAGRLADKQADRQADRHAVTQRGRHSDDSPVDWAATPNPIMEDVRLD